MIRLKLTLKNIVGTPVVGETIDADGEPDVTAVQYFHADMGRQAGVVVSWDSESITIDIEEDRLLWLTVKGNTSAFAGDVTNVEKVNQP